MFKEHKRILISVCIGIALTVIVAAITGSYKRKVLYEAKQYTLWSLFALVTSNIDASIEQNERLMDGWKYVLSQGDYDDDEFCQYIEKEKEIWNFTTFYFINNDKVLTYDGFRGTSTKDKAEIYGASFAGKFIITSDESPQTGEMETLYIMPIEGTYRNFEYTAIGVSYPETEMKALLSDGEYAQSCNLYVVDSDSGMIMFDSFTEDIDDTNVYEMLADAVFTDTNMMVFEASMKKLENRVEEIYLNDVEYYLIFLPVGFDDLQLVVLADKVNTDLNLDNGQLASSVMQAIVFSVLILIVLLLLVEYTIIEKKHRDNEIKYREAGFNSLVAHNNNAIVMYDINTRKLDYVTESVHWAFGIEPDKLKENYMSYQDCVVKQEDRDFILNAGNIESGGYRNKNIIFRNYITGEERIFDLGILRSNLPEMSNKCVMAFLDKTDEIKKEKEMQDLLEAAQNANATKSQFLVNMSHIFRTPMNALGGYIALLQKNIDNKYKVKEYADKLDLSYKDMLGLVNNLLEMSKNASGETMLDINEFSISEAIGVAISAIEFTAKNLNLTIEAKKHNLHTEMFMGDSGKLVQILQSILANAVQYNREGGHVWVNVTGEGPVVDGFQELRISVADDGFGMDKDTLDNLFEPFSVDITNSPEKMKHKGMSIMIAKSIIDVMGGTISAESTPDIGTTVTIRLKLKCIENAVAVNSEESIWITEKDKDGKENEATGVLNEVQKELRTDIKNLKILVVEDNEVNAEILIDMLEFDGASCEHAADGVIADQMFEASEVGYYDIILMDLMMPNRNGYEATDVIRKMDRPDAASVPIVALSANSYPDDIEKCFRAGMNGHAAKPIDLAKLEEAILKAVNSN